MSKVIIVPTQTIAFERTSRRGFYEVSLSEERRYIPSRLFYAVFPQMNRKVFAGTVEATDRQLEALGIIADIMDKNRHQIKYTIQRFYDIHGRVCATSYVVNALSLGQTIAITPGAFCRITGADQHATDGCMDVTEAQLDELGFIRREAASNVRSAVLSA